MDDTGVDMFTNINALLEQSVDNAKSAGVSSVI